MRDSVTLRIEAPIAKVWELVSDVTHIGRFSPETFEAEWSIDARDLRLYVSLHEAVQTAVRGRTWVQDLLARRSREYVSGYDLDLSRLEERFGDLDPADPSSMTAAAEHPEAILGAMRSPAQDAAAHALRTLITTLVGYGDAPRRAQRHLGLDALGMGPQLGAVAVEGQRHAVHGVAQQHTPQG